MDSKVGTHRYDVYRDDISCLHLLHPVISTAQS
jgi:hypothetical protein